MSQNFFASCPKGLENLLFQELNTLGLQECRETVAGVYFSGDIAAAYKVCLWSRLANRVLLPLTQATLRSADDLYDAASSIKWETLFSVDKFFAVDFIGTNTQINNSQFGALKIKDAIVDRFREVENKRPSVDKSDPDIRINARLDRKDTVSISLDLSSGSLHARGYRRHQGAAPLKENLAAALLYRAGWPAIAEKGGSLVDPMCGSGTLLIEAVMMAGDIAPGIERPSFGFEHLLSMDSQAWQTLRDDAEMRRDQGLNGLSQAQEKGQLFKGNDLDAKVLQAAKRNLQDAGLSELISLQRSSVFQLADTESTAFSMDTLTKGLVISNPPYGERLGDQESLRPVYQALGFLLLNHFQDWRAAIFTADKELGFALGFRAEKKYAFFNGTIATQLLCFDVNSTQVLKKLTQAIDEGTASGDTQLNSKGEPQERLSSGALMVYNRLKKNNKRLKSWLKKEAVDCYRLYDADMPEYSAAIDIYSDYAHVQEYAPPKTVDQQGAMTRFNELLDALVLFTGFSRESIFIKQRKQHKGDSQYEKLADNDSRPLIIVKEYQAELLVNLWSYLDTGLFLDHRPVRRRIFEMSQGKRFLNLFCYTATATVQAVLGGAAASVSVDMSATYIKWAKENLINNNIRSNNHQLVQADCIDWLRNCREGFDVILLDPPSFSNSKRMAGVFDVQEDHSQLVHRCMELLNPGGQLLFSNNLRRFELDQELINRYQPEDITKSTLDPDFTRNSHIHNCWLFSS